MPVRQILDFRVMAILLQLVLLYFDVPFPVPAPHAISAFGGWHVLNLSVSGT
jgi:hypothetical protein